ncbi:MAG: ABC transporter substrate-binding protein [Chloroflexi bacterium]|nr:ABC transporter substrate-binding protein [Chloroflexota bacterium]
MKHLRTIVFLLLVAVIGYNLAGCAATPTATQAPTQPPAAAVPTQAAGAPTTPPQAAAPTTVPAQPSSESHTLVIAMNISDLVSLDPAVAQESTNQFLHANVYDTLVTFKAPAYDKPIGLLADSWDVSSDAKTYTFHLKKDIKFASGNPLTAQDVVFTWQRGKNIKINSFFQDIDTVSAPDDYTVVVTIVRPAADFLAEVSAPAFGIMDSKVVQAHGGTDAVGADTTDTAKQWLDQNSAGSAAYVLTKWAQKSEVDLVANPNWRGGKPYFDKVIIKDAEDPTALLQMVQTGDADLGWNVSIDLADQAKSDPNLQVVVNQSLDTWYLAMTSGCTTKQSPETAAILCKTDVRQAIAHAIDYKGLIDAILKGYAVHAPAVIPIGMSVIDPSKAPTTDVAKAKELLAQAGYPNGATIDFTYNSNAQTDIIAAKLKSDMAAIGITANLKPMEATVYLTAMRAQELPIAFGAWTPDYLDPSMWTDNYSCIDTQIAHRMQYDNPAACDLGKKIKAEVDPAKRQQEIAQLQQIWLDDMPFLNLFQPQYITAMSKDLKGFEYHPSRYMDLSLLSK